MKPSTKEREAYQYFINKGYTPEVASAIVGNFMHESGLNTTIEGDKGYKGGSSFGLAQWRGERLSRLKSKYGDKWTDFKNQLEFTDWELKNTHKKAGEMLKKAKTVDEAGAIFSDYYEIPAKKYYQDANRRSKVNKVYSSIGGMNVKTDFSNFEETKTNPTFVDVVHTQYGTDLPQVKEEKKSEVETAKEEIKQKTAEKTFLEDLKSNRLYEQPQEEEEQYTQPQEPQKSTLQSFSEIENFIDNNLFQEGGTIYVDSKNDPRYKAYQDSLNLYNKGNKSRIVFNENLKKYLKGTKYELINKNLDIPSTKDEPITPVKKTQLANYAFSLEKDGKHYARLSEEGEFDFPKDIYDSEFKTVYQYKKPIQRVILETSQQREKVQPLQNTLQPADLFRPNMQIEADFNFIPMARTPREYQVETSGGGNFGGWTRNERVVDPNNISVDDGNNRKITPIYQEGGEKNSLWKNIRENRGSGKKPTKEMLEQERKIKREYEEGGQIPISRDGVFASGDKPVIVPSPSIDMSGVNYPILGISTETGERKVMMPDQNYFFKNTANVIELPMMQQGGNVSEIYTQQTGLPWQTAKESGLTDGSLEKNLELRAKILKIPLSKTSKKESNYIRANTFEEAFSVARKELGANQIFDWKGRKYGTNLKGESFTPSDEVIKQAGLPVDKIKKRIEDENTKVEDPYITKSTVKLEPEWKEWNKVKQEKEDFNRKEQADRIVEYKAKNRTGQDYVIIDKKKGLLHIYKEGENKPLFSSAVDLGANEGDSQTVTKYKDINKDGKITDADKVNGKFKVDWDAGNMTTGAGKYYISNIDLKGYEGLPLLNMMNEQQYEKYKKTGKIENVATSFHKGYIKDDESRVSNGCIRCNKTTLDNLSKYLKNTSEVYILPEDEGNEFILENDKLNFKSRKDYSKYTDKKGNEQKGQGINRTINTLNYKPVKISVNEEKFKKDIFTWSDFNDEKEYNQTTKPFVQALSDNKKKIMQKTKINGDVYNDIAKIAFGIYGVESNFGDTHSAFGNLGRAINKAVSPSTSSSPDYKSKYETYRADKGSNSVGLTQIRFNMLDEQEKKTLRELGITKNEQLLEPDKAALATVAILALRYNNQLNDKEKADLENSLPKRWNNRGNYTQRVKKATEYLNILELN